MRMILVDFNEAIKYKPYNKASLSSIWRRKGYIKRE